MESSMEKKSNYYFLILLLLVSLLYGYTEIFYKSSNYHHLWRQSDCLSITMNYYKENLNFFTPAIHWVGDKGGKTISEFPIIYYTVTQRITINITPPGFSCRGYCPSGQLTPPQ
jgi:hypothetical protein